MFYRKIKKNINASLTTMVFAPIFAKCVMDITLDLLVDLRYRSNVIDRQLSRNKRRRQRVTFNTVR